MGLWFSFNPLEAKKGTLFIPRLLLGLVSKRSEAGFFEDLHSASSKLQLKVNTRRPPCAFRIFWGLGFRV